MEKGSLEDQEEVVQKRLCQIERVFEAAPDGILATSKENKILLANKRAACLLGGESPDDLLGKSILDLISPEDRERAHIDGWGFLAWYPFLLTSYRMLGKEAKVISFEVCRSVFGEETEEEMLWIWTLREGAERETMIRGLLDQFEGERERMGWDLHDGISSRVLGVAFFLDSLEKRWTRGEVSFSEIADMAEELRNVARATRSLIHHWSPLMGTPDALTKGLRELAKKISHQYAISCSVEEELEVSISDKDRATHLYRIVQEAVNNAVVHGKAKHVEIRLKKLPDGRAELMVKDDGLGISQTVDATGGMGTAIMHCRGQRINAAVNFQERMEGGTVVRCTFQP